MFSAAFRATISGAITDLLNTTGAGATVGLFQNDVTPSPTIKKTDLVEANFGGYAALTTITGWLTLHDPGTDDEVSVPPTAQLFAADNTIVAPQTIFGYFVELGDASFVSAVRFAVPVTVSADGDFVLANAQCRLINIAGI